MAVDYTAPSFSGGTPSGVALTSAFADIETALGRALSIDGTLPNAMEVDLDLNGHDIINVGSQGGTLLTSDALDAVEASVAAIRANDTVQNSLIATARTDITNLTNSVNDNRAQTNIIRARVDALVQDGLTADLAEEEVNALIDAKLADLDVGTAGADRLVGYLESGEPFPLGVLEGDYVILRETGEARRFNGLGWLAYSPLNEAKFEFNEVEAAAFAKPECPLASEVMNSAAYTRVSAGDTFIYFTPRHKAGTAIAIHRWEVTQSNTVRRLPSRALPHYWGTNLTAADLHPSSSDDDGISLLWTYSEVLGSPAGTWYPGSDSEPTQLIAPGTAGDSAETPENIIEVMTFDSMAALTATGATQIYVQDNPRKGMFDVVTTDISGDVLLDPEQGYYVPFAGTDGSTGGFVRDLNEVPQARFFGVEWLYLNVEPTAQEISDASAANTPKLQAMINWTAHNRRVECHVGVGRYYFGRLYLTRDPVNNLGFPDDDHLHGRIVLKGAAVGSRPNYANPLESVGTYMISTDPVGPAIYANGDPLGADRNITNKVRVEKMCVEATNSTEVINLYRCPQYSGLTEIVLMQNGTGGGLYMNQRWLSYFHNVYCQGPSNSTGVGFNVLNNATTPNSLAGGFNVLDQITCQGWRVGVMIGGEKVGDGLRSHGYTCSSVQGGDSDVGILLGHNTQNIHMTGNHVENNTLGMHICSGASNVTVVGSTSNNILDMMLGYGTTGIAEVDAVTTAAGHVAADDRVVVASLNMIMNAGSNTKKHVAVFSGAERVTFDRPSFVFGTNAPNVISAVWLEDAVLTDFEMHKPTFSPNYPIEIENKIRLSSSRAEQSLSLIANGTSTMNGIESPYSSIVYGTNTANSVYRTINVANMDKPHGWSQTIINSPDSLGFYNIQDHTTTNYLQIQPGESAKIIYNAIAGSWIFEKPNSARSVNRTGAGYSITENDLNAIINVTNDITLPVLPVSALRGIVNVWNDATTTINVVAGAGATITGPTQIEANSAATFKVRTTNGTSTTWYGIGGIA